MHRRDFNNSNPQFLEEEHCTAILKATDATKHTVTRVAQLAEVLGLHTLTDSVNSEVGSRLTS